MPIWYVVQSGESTSGKSPAAVQVNTSTDWHTIKLIKATKTRDFNILLSPQNLEQTDVRR
jgi:hypothetical protein